MNNCIFCKIISNEISSYTIYEDEHFKVILDKFPSSIGHCLIIPKNHVENIFEIDENISKNIFSVAKTISTTLKKSFNIDGLNIIQNNGAYAGQTIYHFHIHLIPRYKNDKLNFTFDSLNLDESDFIKILDNINKNL